jgi:hypothetical protein
VLKKIALLPLVAGVLLAQSAGLSDAAQKLLEHPRLGDAKFTLTDGRKPTGQVVRVTDQFISLATNLKPRTCEQIEVSQIASVEWYQAKIHSGRGRTAMEAAYLGPILAPFYVGNAISKPFKRISPPLKPLRGTWESEGAPGGPSTAVLEFSGKRVEYRSVIVKQGRWSIEQNRLHLQFPGEPEAVTSFRFDCAKLVLENPDRQLVDRRDRRRVAAPAVGNWQGKNYALDLKSDGTAIERETYVRTGSFENRETDVTFHWSESTGPGGAEWVGQIKHRHLWVGVTGVPDKFHYVPPGVALDL